MIQNNDLSQIMAYGDHLHDGLVQLSFTLTVPYTNKAKKAALIMARKMGIESPDVVYAEELVTGYTFFIIYGHCMHTVNYSNIKDKNDQFSVYTKKQVEDIIKEKLGFEIVVIGASTGTDAHTVGIDSILNMKGNDGHYGLERYQGFKVYNLGGQIPNEVLIAKAIEINAHAILVSQTVTQQRLHIQNLTQFVDMVESEGIREKVLLICGGHRITNELAKELGFDAGFTKGSYSNHVATYIINELLIRHNKKLK